MGFKQLLYPGVANLSRFVAMPQSKDAKLIVGREDDGSARHAIEVGQPDLPWRVAMHDAGIVGRHPAQ